MKSQNFNHSLSLQMCLNFSHLHFENKIKSASIDTRSISSLPFSLLIGKHVMLHQLNFEHYLRSSLTKSPLTCTKITFLWNFSPQSLFELNIFINDWNILMTSFNIIWKKPVLKSNYSKVAFIDRIRLHDLREKASSFEQSRHVKFS